MKLLFCPICHDVLGLLDLHWRTCICGCSGGQYNPDGMTATIGGMGKVFGVGNPFFNDLYPFLENKGKREMRQKFYGQPDSDCWWGDYPGERQIFHIQDPTGPRVKTKIVKQNVTSNTIAIVDKRQVWIDGKDDIKEVTVPRNTQIRKLGRKRL